MSQIDEASLTTRRVVACVLVLFSALLMSARIDDPGREERSLSETGLSASRVVAMPEFSVSVAPSVAAHAEEVIRRSNPSLSSHERIRIGAAIERYSAAYGLDPDLVLGVILVESNARPWAHSPKGAVGLMQVMPHMMEPLGLAGNFATIESNIAAGCFILAHNIGRLGFEDGISAYFWGSQIRDRTYLEKVLEARQRVRGHRAS